MHREREDKRVIALLLAVLAAILLFFGCVFWNLWPTPKDIRQEQRQGKERPGRQQAQDRERAEAFRLAMEDARRAAGMTKEQAEDAWLFLLNDTGEDVVGRELNPFERRMMEYLRQAEPETAERICGWRKLDPITLKPLPKRTRKQE